MHHTSSDGPGAHDAYLDDDIVVVARAQPGKHCHLCAAFDLKRTDRIGATYHLIRRTIVGGNCRHGETSFVV